MKTKKPETILLVPDPKNARKHSEKNKSAIHSSLKQCGTGRSLVVDAENVIIAGNGVYEQGRALGIPIRLIESDGTELIAIKRMDLRTNDQKRKLLALADNRSSELGEWNDEILNSVLFELKEFDLDLKPIGFDFEGINLPDSITPEMLMDSMEKPSLKFLFEEEAARDLFLNEAKKYNLKFENVIKK